jgi:uridylate kinase
MAKKSTKKETLVFSVGGSLIFPDEIDTIWLSSFKKIIEDYSNKYKFIIICGGGKLARRYQAAARELVELKDDDLDWLGIKCTIMNANLVQAMFKKIAHKEVITNPTKKIRFSEKVLIAAGWKPGCSTDYDTILFAKSYAVTKVVNFTNVDYIYDKDPNKYEDAKQIHYISWNKFREMLPKKWSPGLNSPFDPIAAKEAEKQKIEVAVLNGRNLNNLKLYLDKKPFIGTVIHNNDK